MKAPPDSAGSWGGSESSSFAGARRWEKVLYRRQCYPDNHVDTTFLESLVLNENAQPYEYWDMVRSSASLTGQVSAVAVFLLGIMTARAHNVPLLAVLVVDLAVTACVSGVVHVASRLSPAPWALGKHGAAGLGGLLNVHSRPVVVPPAAAGANGTPGQLPAPSWERRLASGAQALVMVAFLLMLSPIVQTLTQSYCSDTIWALTLFLCSIHIASHDYRPEAVYPPSGGSVAPMIPGTLSLNAGLFAALLLSSRLPSTAHVFVFLVVAIQLFAAYPLARRYTMARSDRLHLWIAAILVCLTVALLLLVGNTLTVGAYLCAVGLVSFVAPAWFLSMQQYKHVSRGPWDVARVSHES